MDYRMQIDAESERVKLLQQLMEENERLIASMRSTLVQMDRERDERRAEKGPLPVRPSEHRPSASR